MIEFDNVCKSFWTGKTRKVILHDASFRLELGRSFGILAANGTGKTTLLNMVAGLEKPDSGKVRRTCRVSFPLGYSGGLLNTHTARENARYIADIYNVDPDYLEAFCRWTCNLGEYFEQPLAIYSSGMRQRFSFALLMAMDFDVYLIDEGMPQNTDIEFNRKAEEIIKARQEDTTFVVVSHSPEILKKYCDYAAVLRNGQLFVFDTLEEAGKMYKYDDE